MKRTAPRVDSSGFALLFVLILLLVLTVSGFLIAGTTRIDTQIVNTIRNERIAFYAAEAGIAEARQRLDLAAGATASPSGVGTFDATFKGAFAPDASDPAWNAQIVFAAAGAIPSKSGSTVTTPSIQPAASRLAYSTASAGNATNLRLRWDVCTAVDAARGCDAVGAIRKLDGRNVLQVVSIGRSGFARRRVVVDLLLGDATSAVVLDASICPGINAQGSGTVDFPGGVTVNSTCATSIETKGAAAITAAGPINVAGTGYSGNITPPPTTEAPQVTDPLATLPEPTYPSLTIPIRHGAPLVTPTAKKIKNATVPLSPGVYYGGIDIQSNGHATLSPGIYVLAGGGLSVAANGSISGAGVMIFNTCSRTLLGACITSGDGDFGPISITAGEPITLTAPTSGIYAGILIFQDRANLHTLSFTSNATGNIDGLIYAANAQLFLSGSADLLHSQLVVGSIDLQGGPSIGEPTAWIDLGGTGGTATAVAWSDG